MKKNCPACNKKTLDIDELEKASSKEAAECMNCHSRVYYYPFLDVARYIFIHLTGLVALLLFVLGYYSLALFAVVVILLAAYSIAKIWPIKIIQQKHAN